MTIEEIGSIGELVAAIATIATLFYLAMQIRHSSEATRGTSQQSLIDTSYDASWELGSDLERLQILGAGLLDFEALNDRDKTIFAMTAQRYFGNLEKGLRLRESGLVDQGTIDYIGGGVLLIVRSEGGARWWETYGKVAPSIVVDFVDQQLANPNSPQASWDEVWPYWARWAAEVHTKDEPDA